MTEMIERVARALHEVLAGSDPDELIHHPAQKSWDAPSWRRWQQWDDAARAAIEAMREPTQSMVDEVTSSEPLVQQIEGDHAARYRSMIDAALT